MLTELNIVSFEVENLGSTEDGHVLNLGLSDGRAVVGDEDELGLAVSHGSHGELVTCRNKGALANKRVGDLPTLYFPDLMTKLSLSLVFSEVLSFFPMMLLSTSVRGPVKLQYTKR